jgi:hypothetical protein
MPASGGRRPAVTAWRVLRGVAALAWVFGVWWLASGPGERSPVVEAFVAGGWGLSLLPVHVAARRPRRSRRRTSPDRRIFTAHGRVSSASGWQRGHQ